MNTQAKPTIALVTGGSRGLGREMALELARAGHDLVITYKSRADDAAAVKAEIEALGRKAAVLPLDAGDIASFESFGKRLDEVLREGWQRHRIDYLVNNGGMSVQGKLGD